MIWAGKESFTGQHAIICLMWANYPTKSYFIADCIFPSVISNLFSDARVCLNDTFNILFQDEVKAFYPILNYNEVYE